MRNSTLAWIIAACFLLWGCAPRASDAVPQGDSATGASSAENKSDKAAAASKGLPAGTFRTDDWPADAWPDYRMPLEIMLKLPEVPKEIQGPSPPIREEPVA